MLDLANLMCNASIFNYPEKKIDQMYKTRDINNMINKLPPKQDKQDTISRDYNLLNLKILPEVILKLKIDIDLLGQNNITKKQSILTH